MALIGVGETRKEGKRRADQILGYSRTSGIVAPQFANPPGYVPAPGAAQMLKGGGAMAARATRVQRKDGTPINPRTMSVDDAVDAGLSFAGTPDDVFDQLKALRPRRRLRPPVDDGPGRLHQPRRHRRQPHPVQPRGAAEAGGIGVRINLKILRKDNDQ